MEKLINVCISQCQACTSQCQSCANQYISCPTLTSIPTTNYIQAFRDTTYEAMVDSVDVGILTLAILLSLACVVMAGSDIFRRSLGKLPDVPEKIWYPAGIAVGVTVWLALFWTRLPEQFADQATGHKLLFLWKILYMTATGLKLVEWALWGLHSCAQAIYSVCFKLCPSTREVERDATAEVKCEV